MFRSLLRNILLDILGRIFKPSKGTHFLNGHYVFPGNTSIEVQRNVFYHQINLLSTYCTLVDPQIAISERFQKSQPLVCLTFDDGYSDVFSVIAPVLKMLNLKAIVFLNPAFLDLDEDATKAVLSNNYTTGVVKRFLTNEEVAEVIRAGHIIGSHSLTHRRLSTNDESVLKAEIVNSKNQIQKKFDIECNCFAYPFGGRNDLSAEALALASVTYDYIFSSINREGLFSFENRVINRRHFEGNWPVNHINYFLSGRK